MDDRNPQREQMSSEAMVRTLAAQAEAIWPQERALLERYGLSGPVHILDAGCGTGEVTARLAEHYPEADVLGVDVLEGSLERARERAAAFGERVRFENRSVYELGLPDATFDLVACRHVLQSIPDAEQVLAELLRVTRPGGWLHVLAEDYGLIRFAPGRLDSDDFWTNGPRLFGEAAGTDMRIGRRAFGLLRRLGVEDVRVDHVVVDPVRVPRETIIAIWEAWRDGYAAPVAPHLGLHPADLVAQFDDMIATLRDPDGYGVWFVPVAGGRRPC